MSDSQPLVTIIDETCAAATGESTTVAEALDGLGHMSHAALVLLPALVVVTPLSGIPGLSSLLGITIGLVSLQMIAGAGGSGCRNGSSGRKWEAASS